MTYFIIAGEASGDLHARHLMDAIKAKDSGAVIRYWYRPELAYMGFLSVLVHLPEILQGMKECRKAILDARPDRLILVDYPGFNLKIAAWFHKTYVRSCKQGGVCPEVVYYIPPKIWAWKEGRIAQIRKYVDKVLSILPFEVEWYAEKYGYHVDYVGNPTLDEITLFLASSSSDKAEKWRASLGISGSAKVVALLPGSRKQEIESNLPMMLRAAEAAGGDFCYVIASAPNMTKEFYDKVIGMALGHSSSRLRGRVMLAPCQGSWSSFMLLQNAHAALVTSGTATLETAIMSVPQVVCYAMRCGKLVSFLRRFLLKVPYVSLVNLVVGREVVPELVAGELTQAALDKCFSQILLDEECRFAQRSGYDELMRRLGQPGAPERA
ncbi:MAG: lipid-A-disaccharide synthase, partial [Bacteroidaceae bacterium]|nr:lipid-A-disaccharide synthase [Bacteroidaceae bacterium]